jgi:hypothetical protein
MEAAVWRRIMDATTERKFNFKGRTFTLKLNVTPDGYTVISYWKGRRVSPVYSVRFLPDREHYTQNKDIIIDVLFCGAQRDIEHELYFHPRTMSMNFH